MALQGDLDSFALPDVLRLLAGTGKSGRLAISSPAGAGEVWMRDGDLVGGSATTSVYAGRMADVVFELLRLGGGAFVFDEGEQLVEAGERSRVEDTIVEAQALVVEWEDVERVVPSVHARVLLRRELDGEGIHISAAEWRVLAAIAGGATVRQLGDRFELTDLAACKQVKGLVEAGLVEFSELEADTFDIAEPADDFAGLHDDHATVLLETHADALLPEPLPGEGTAFGDDLDGVGHVDGIHHAEEHPADPADALGQVGGRSFEEMESLATSTLSAMDDPAGWDEASLAELAEIGDADLEPVADEAPEAVAADEAEPEVEADDRGSLLKFLSTVKP